MRGGQSGAVRKTAAGVVIDLTPLDGGKVVLAGVAEVSDLAFVL